MLRSRLPRRRWRNAASIVQNEAESRCATPPWSLSRRERRRSRAAELPDRDTEPLRLVGEVVLDSRARKVHNADRQEFEHGVVALEWGRLGVSRPVGLEGDLWHLAVGRPFGGDQFGAFRRAA